MRDWTEDRPSLDRPPTGPWVGRFPGLGTVTVAEDGQVTATPEDGTGADDGEELALREAALRYGWGEALSFARRGFSLAHGAALSPLADAADQPGGTCLILTGDPHDVAIVILQLVDVGWSVMGDKYTPTRWEDSVLVAYPREAPVLIAHRRLQRNELTGVKVRAHTDSRSFDLPRTQEARRVAGVVSLQMRRPDEAAFEVLTGHQRFETAANLLTGGATRPWRADEDDAIDSAGEAVPAGTETAASTADPGTVPEPDEKARAREERVRAAVAESLATNMRLAQLPAARLRLDSDTVADDCDALLAWWGSLTEGSGA